MKYIIIFLSFNLFALTNYIPEIKNNKTYPDQAVCMKESGQACYPFDSSEDVETMAVKEIEVDNPERPIYAKATNVTPCKIGNVGKDGYEFEDDCRKLIENVNVGSMENPILQPVLCTDKSFVSVYRKVDESYEAYCTKKLGYEPMTIKALQVDASLVTAKQLKQEQENVKQELIILKNKQIELLAWEAVKAKETLTPEQIAEVDKKIDELKGKK